MRQVFFLDQSEEHSLDNDFQNLDALLQPIVAP
jgi:hypothetical protein